MLHKRIYLFKDNTEAYLDAYIADRITGFERDAVIVIPGGGYGEVCSEREGEPVAMAFIPYGYNAFVFHYSTGNKKTFPAQLIELSMAVKHIKDNAKEYNINKERIFLTGFSAGGHLAGSLAQMWNRKEIYEAIDMPYGYNKPCGAMLIYPVVSGVEEYASMECFKNLLGTENPSYDEFADVSLEKHVGEHSVPLYIVHTSNDELVDVRNSLKLAEAYRENNLTFEMHIYPDGPHGVSLGNKITECGCKKWVNKAISKWVENAVIWADNL